MKVNKISIITPCLNAGQFIGETIDSILNQTAILKKRVELEYIICDGASVDNTLEVVNSFRSPYIKIISEKDNGMYEALAKGLKMVTGDIVSYLNAGDFYNKTAFDVVLDIFETKDVKWLHGINVTYNYKSQIIGCQVPYKFRRSFIKKGLYGRVLPFIQQESVFWLRELNKFIDLDKLSKFKYAGDYYLWHTFAKYSDLKIVYSYLGGFKIMKGQLSSNMDKYLEELEQIADNYSFVDVFLAWIDKIIMVSAPRKVKKMLNKRDFYYYDTKLDEWI